MFHVPGFIDAPFFIPCGQALQMQLGELREVRREKLSKGDSSTTYKMESLLAG